MNRLLRLGVIAWIVYCALGIILGVALVPMGADEPRLTGLLIVSGSIGVGVGVWLYRLGQRHGDWGT